MATNLLAGQASIWVQVDGPNTEPKYLGCHAVGDIAEPLGDITMLYCPDPSAAGKFNVKNSFAAEPGSITATIETDMRKTADYLEDLSCPVPIFIHKVSCGRRDVFTSYDRTFVLRQARVTSRTLGSLAARTPGDEKESTQSFDISAQFITRIFNLEASRISISETEDITNISICGEDRCESTCGASQAADDAIYVSSKALVGSAANTADVNVSLNGSVFAPTGSDPFIGGKDIQGVVCFKVGRDTTRVLVAKGTSEGGQHAEIAYSDDGGTTWTNVDVGTIDAEYVANGHALFALDRYHIWLGTDGGYIYFSSDAGVSWAAQESAGISATDVVGISFVDTLTGFAVYTGGQVAKCIDGSTWSAVTTSGATTCTDIHAVSAYTVWVSGANGMFFSNDSGANWTQRNSYVIGAIDFMDELFGIAVGSGASGIIYNTINGGYDWSQLPAITNAGMTDVTIVNSKLAFVCGKASGGTGFIAKISPES